MSAQKKSMRKIRAERKELGLIHNATYPLTPSDKLKADELYSESESAKIERARKGSN